MEQTSIKPRHRYEHLHGETRINHRIEDGRTGRLIRSETMTFQSAAEAAKIFEQLHQNTESGV